jgi:hypothetical protein
MNLTELAVIVARFVLMFSPGDLGGNAQSAEQKNWNKFHQDVPSLRSATLGFFTSVPRKSSAG